VIAVQMFTAREEIPFLEGIPTPNSNYPRTGKEEERTIKTVATGRIFAVSQQKCWTVRLVSTQLGFVLLELAVKSSFPDPKQTRGN